MHGSVIRILLSAVVAGLGAGCATTGSSDPVASTVYSTHQIARNLDQNLGGTVTKLNETATDLNQRMSEAEQRLHEVQSKVSEQQSRLDGLHTNLQDMRNALYRHLGLSVSQPRSSSPAPAAPRTGVDAGRVTIEPPAR